MRKIAQFGKYIRSLAIPPWSSFTVLANHFEHKIFTDDKIELSQVSAKVMLLFT
jgi:hypothetical protein